MTRKDYELIADAISQVPRTTVVNDQISNTLYRCGQDSILRAVTAALIIDNPRFDVGRFLEACGV